jgi:hypothetical protein
MVDGFEAPKIRIEMSDLINKIKKTNLYHVLVSLFVVCFERATVQRYV